MSAPGISKKDVTIGFVLSGETDGLFACLVLYPMVIRI